MKAGLKGLLSWIIICLLVMISVISSLSKPGHHGHGPPTPTPRPTATPPPPTPTPVPTPTSTPPPTPTPLPTPPSVSLAWDPETDPSVDGYNLWMGFTSGAETRGANLGLVSMTTIQLTSGVTYYFVVTAHNTVGDSLPSNEISFVAP